MKKILLQLCILFSLSVHSQEILNETWYLNKVEIDGESFYQPDNSNLGFQTNFYPDYAETSICNHLMMDYSDLTDSEFMLTGFSSTLIECPDQPGLDEFEGMYASLFWWNENQTFTYEIQVDSEWTHIHTLIITNPQGNKAFYGNDALNTFDLKDKFIRIYPNPFQDKITIENPNLKVDQIQIFDVNGKSFGSYKITEEMNELNLVSLPAGVYFIQIKSSGKTIKTEKIIKNK